MRIISTIAALFLTLGFGLGLASESMAATTKQDGKTLSVKPARNLSPLSANVTIKGRGFDPRVGIYVALCQTPTKNSKVAPGPCGGGINMSGANPASAWISSNPPSYGKSLAVPFKKGGSFKVKLTINPIIGELDCRTTSCSIVTRADHTRPNERTSDVAVPVTFSK